MPSTYDDELWELVPEDAGPPPEHLTRFVRGLPRAAHALDLGCGDGRLTASLDAERVTAADVSDVALERARGRLPGVRFVRIGADRPLPFEDAEFDLVLCAETIEHAVDVGLLLSECRRVLRPEGRLAVTTPAHGRRTGLEVLLRGFESRFEPLSPHLRFFTRRSLSRALGDAGFGVTKLRRRSGSLLAEASL